MTSIKIKFLWRKKQQAVLYKQDFLFEKSISQSVKCLNAEKDN